MDEIAIEHALQIIGIVVGVTSAIIAFTCGLVLKWINTMREDFKDLKKEFGEFVRVYYERHEETMKKEDCLVKHAKMDSKVDRLHGRLDEHEMRHCSDDTCAVLIGRG